MSTLKTGALRGTSGTADTLTLHASDGSVEIPKLKVGSDAAGDVLYHNGTNYVRLAKGTDGQVLTLASGVPTWADAGGIDVIDTWRKTDQTTGAQDPITGTWERDDEPNNCLLGGGVSESSGVFTFPKTGMYDIRFFAKWFVNGTERYADTYIVTSTNGSSWNNATQVGGSISGAVDSSNTVQTTVTSYLFDVRDLSHAVRFAIYFGNNSVGVSGNTDICETYVQFIRLAAT